MERNMDESEKKFEEWFRAIETGDDGKWELPVYKSPEWNAYLLRRQLALGAWQASRAAIALDMPEPFKLDKSSSVLTYYYQDEVDAVLSCAGIKVKE